MLADNSLLIAASKTFAEAMGSITLALDELPLLSDLEGRIFFSEQ